MKLFVKIGLLFFYYSVCSCQSSESNIIQQLKESMNDSKLTSISSQEILHEFETTYPSYPIIEDGQATFIYRGAAEKVQVAGDLNNWDPKGTDFSLIPNSDIWYKTMSFEDNARLDYKLLINESDWILDPKNPFQQSGGWGPNSELRMAEYVPAWELTPSKTVKTGSVLDYSIYSQILDRTFSLKIYLPYAYDKNFEKKYPVAYFQDGYDVISLGDLPTVLDNLIEQNKIEPLIAICVQFNSRESEYVGAEKDKYREFFVSELIPFVDKEFNTFEESDSRAVIGASYGANISAQIAFQNWDTVSKCGAHSGAYQPENNRTMKLIVENINAPVDYIAIWGSYEGVYINNREIQKAYQQAGIPHTSIELPEGHSWGLWKATFDEMLIRFFPYLNN